MHFLGEKWPSQKMGPYKDMYTLGCTFTSPQCKIIDAYHTSNYTLAIEIGLWPTVPISRDNILCQICYGKAVENEARFYVGVSPLQLHYVHVPFSISECSAKHNISKPFFQLDLQVDTNLNLAETIALRYSIFHPFQHHLYVLLVP